MCYSYIGDIVNKFNFKKKFGQNFLRNDNIVNSIVDKSNIQEESLVIEVGPGQGALTKKLAKVAKNVICYEIDTDLEVPLIKLQKEYQNVYIHFCDFLESDIENDLKDYDYNHLYFISNVPYYITTPILMKIMSSNLKFEKIVMMVQKEVGDRFSAKPGNREYSSITVFLNYFYDIKKLLNVSRNEFVPIPNVDSEVISFSLKEKKEMLKDEKLFFQLVRDSFKFKRKTIRNNLKKYNLQIIEQVLHEYGFDLNSRAEQIPFIVFVKISNALC